MASIWLYYNAMIALKRKWRYYSGKMTHSFGGEAMRVAVIGSRKLKIEHLERYLPKETTEIVSGGAIGTSNWNWYLCIEGKYAYSHSHKLTEFIPEYRRYGGGAPLKRNWQIVDYSDLVIAFWDGKSRGTKYVIDLCVKRGKKIIIYRMGEDE